MNDTAESPPPAQLPLARRLRLLVKACSSLHRPGQLPDIFLFATPRSGSTWLMEIIASQPGFKYFDEPLNPRRENVRFGNIFRDFTCLMPDAGNDDRIIDYLRGLQAGRHRYMNPAPFRRNHRFFTSRTVFKIHEIEHLMDRVVLECRGLVVYLIRHPIANSISRTVQPRLDLFVRSEHFRQLVGDPERIRFAEELVTRGTPFQRAILSWCYENLHALTKPNPGLLVLTYEELVLNPGRCSNLLATRLQLPERDLLCTAFERPAANIGMSQTDTMTALANPDVERKRVRLVTKWRDGIAEVEYAQTQEILHVFDIKAYDPRQPVAAPGLLHFADTPDKLLSIRPGQPT